jgi:hypothetical protein
MIFERWDQGFCYNSTKALVINKFTMKEGVENCQKIRDVICGRSFTASSSAGVKKNLNEILSGTMNMIKNGKNKAA